MNHVDNVPLYFCVRRAVAPNCMPVTPNPPTIGIEHLADFPAVQQIQRALWGVSATRGAAVLIGAGFSRNAEFPAPNSPKPPLWSDFAREIADRIYPAGGAPSDPLRLAEEYKGALGPVALETLINDLVRDGEWLPGIASSEDDSPALGGRANHELGYSA